MDDFERALQRYMDDPAFRQEWEAGEEEFRIRLAIVRARADKNMSQAQLARASGVDQRVLSRIETGASVPSIKTLKRIARGLGKVLVVGFEDPPAQARVR